MIEEFILGHPYYSYFMIGLFSLMVGSLLNVVIYRLPIMLETEWKQECSQMLSLPTESPTTPINLFFPRSFCPSCKKGVTAWQNIPILSYLFLGGKCHYCKTPISIRYPLIELLTLILSMIAAARFGLTLQLPFALVAVWLLIPLMFIDIDTQLLPDSLTLGLLWLGLIANTQSLFTSLNDAVLSAAGAYLVLWLFIKLFYLITGKIGMGNGDFKLLAAFGAWFGWLFLPLILLASSFAGAIVGILYLKLSKQSRDTTIPFGPFLCMAGIVSLFWGHSIVNWYLRMWIPL